MSHLICAFLLAISIHSAFAGTKTWPCIARQCPNGDACTGPYGCDPPRCTTPMQNSDECARLTCLASNLCEDNFLPRSGTGQRCSAHSTCSINHLCENDVCTQTTQPGSFEICNIDQTCQVDQSTRNERCLKYVPSQQFAGVCVQQSLDPANTPPTPPPNGPNADQSRNRASNCDQHRDLCTNPFYQRIMKEQCPQTCRDAGADLRCIDNHPNCAYWVANGYCDQAFYSTDQKRERCPKSCNLC